MDDTELVKRVFLAQKISPCKNDWVIQIEQDLKDCQIIKTETEMKNMKEHTFKKMVKESVKELSVRYLLSLKIKKTIKRNQTQRIFGLLLI